MSIIFFNGIGCIGVGLWFVVSMSIGVVLTKGFRLQDSGTAMIHIVQIGALAASVYALSVDRVSSLGLLAAFQQPFLDFDDPRQHPEAKVAFFMMPLAFATLPLPLFVIGAGIVDRLSMKSFGVWQYAWWTLNAGVYTAASAFQAYRTESQRLLAREPKGTAGGA